MKKEKQNKSRPTQPSCSSCGVIKYIWSLFLVPEAVSQKQVPEQLEPLAVFESLWTPPGLSGRSHLLGMWMLSGRRCLEAP